METGTAVRPSETPGPRERRWRQERRRRRWRRLLEVTATLSAAAALTVVAGMLLQPEPGPPADQPTGDPATGPADQAGQHTLLLVRHPTAGGPASGVTLLAAGPGDASAVVLFIPAGTLTDVPGFGLDRLDLAHQYGGAPLLAASVENALGIDVDHVAAVSDSGLASWLGRMGGLELAIPERLVERGADGSAVVRFEPGDQFLDGRRLAEYWGFQARNEDELATFSRQQLVLVNLFAALADEPEHGQQLVAGGLPLDTTADADWLGELLTSLAAAHADGRVSYTLLPVEPFGGSGPDGSPSYRLQERGVTALTAGPLAHSVPAGGGQEAVRVQVLNGVGAPGIGQEVDRRLKGGPFRIVLTDNARSFDFAETQILIYEESAHSVQAAEQVQQRLGVGRILVNRQPQSVVDVTIVVGADFVESGDSRFQNESGDSRSESGGEPRETER